MLAFRALWRVSMDCSQNRSFAVFLLITCTGLGCAPELDPATSFEKNASRLDRTVRDLEQVYPVDPTIHTVAQNAGEGSLDSSSARILNAVAYGRYAAELLGATDVSHVESPETIALALGDELLEGEELLVAAVRPALLVVGLGHRCFRVVCVR